MNQHSETIEKKILDGDYASYEDVLKDVESLTPSLQDERTNGTLVDGGSSQPDSKAKERIAAMREFLTKAARRHIGKVKQDVSPGKAKDDKVTLSHDAREAGSVLTVRTQTNTGPRQVFSGLQRSARLETQGDGSDATTFDIAAPIELKRLPNGFDIVEPSPLEAHMKRKEDKQERAFGDIFAPHRNVKALEKPRPSNLSAPGTSLTFVSPSEACFAQRALPIYKSDHVYSTLPTGQWVRYKQDQAQVDGLFQAAYSSFAPSYDDSSAVIPQRTKTDLWWQKYGRSPVGDAWADEYPEDVLIQTMSRSIPEDGFAELVANFEAGDTIVEEMPKNDPELNDVEDVLREVSDLLRTLSSYQSVRDMESSKLTSSTPSSQEFDTYEILKSQLSILINSLPPFAVAKLDGDQLAELNISTNFVFNSNDYPGIAEPDDAELQKRRAKLAATTAASRTPAPVQTAVRPTTYQAPATNYTQRTPNYSSTTTPYARPAPYQAQRPPSSVAQRPAYPQAQYGSTAAYTQPTSLQQFQRPMPNGYPSYGSSTPQVAAYGNQPKPTINGHRPGPYNNTAAAASPTKVPTLTPQQQMLADRQAQAIRMASASATPGYGGYENTSEKRSETPKTEVKAE